MRKMLDLKTSNSAPAKRPKSFYITIICLCVCVFIATVNTIIVASALPAIASGLNATTTQAYWSGTALVFAQCIAQPIYGAFAEALGRKICLVAALTIFASASLLGATAQNIQWLIGARVVQGLGGGGINVLVNVIIVDLVPQRERAKFSGIIALAGALGLAAGMLCGAALANETWRWVFYINLPICIPTGIGFIFFLHLKEEKKPFLQRVKAMDWTGMAILTSSLVGILLGLVSGGTLYSWTSGHILTPLILGAFGLLGFALFEEFVADHYGFAPPMIPLRLFANRTASCGYLITFIHAVILWAIAYYYLLYLHICDSQSLLASAVTMLPSTIIIPASAALTGFLMTRIARFKYLNALAFLLFIGGLVGLSTLRTNPTRGQQIGFQFLYSIGAGILFPGRLMAVQASQKEEDVRMATALVSFGTSLGQAFGVAMGSTTFQNVWDILVDRDIQNGRISKDMRVDGDQAAKAAEIIVTFPVVVGKLYKSIAAISIARVWIVCAVMAGVGFVAAVLSKNLSLDRAEKEEDEIYLKGNTEATV